MTTRRALLGGILGAVACDRRVESPAPASAPSSVSVVASPPAPPAASSSPSPAVSSAPVAPRPPAEERVEIVSLSFPQQLAICVVPRWADRFPLLIALHGQGEARKGMEAGANGWVHDYWLDRVMMRLRNPPLTRRDFQGFVGPKRLAAINASLVERPFRGLVVACPYTPDLLVEKTLDNAGPFGDFVTGDLTKRARAELPVDTDAQHTGLDGVSLGGRVSLLVGFAHPTSFAAVGSLQAALQVSEAKELGRRAKAARDANPGLKLRLLTSDEDFYRGEIGEASRAMKKAGVEHEYVVIPGPHDYPFNRGPGAIEMLLWHDRVLRGEPA
jgi:hypothetical protein